MRANGKNTCEWEFYPATRFVGGHKTSCGVQTTVAQSGYDPRDMKYCPFCGGRLTKVGR